MGRILVTGGSGFIGTNLIGHLAGQGHEVLNIDIRRPKCEGQIGLWKEIDIRDYSALENGMLEFCPEYVIDLAARTDLKGKSIGEYGTNIKGKENVLRCCEKIDGLKKYIMASSMLVCRPGYVPKNHLDFCPATLYGESKAVAERMLWEKGLRCDWAIVRPTSIWGPWFSAPYKDFFDMVIKGRYFHIGNRSCKKTYGYVKNAVYQIDRILFSISREDRVFYIGDYEEYPIEAWADEIAAQCGRKIIKVPFFLVAVAASLGDLLGRMGVAFPMTSFRLRNMTTDNIVNLRNTQELAPRLPYTRKQGIEETLQWMETERWT